MAHHWFTPPTTEALVFLHGFTGSVHSWDSVVQKLPPGQGAVGLWLPGHHPERPLQGESFLAAVDQVAASIRQLGLERLHLVGYSLGARLGLGLLVRHADLAQKATLIGGHPGLQNADDRQIRADADAHWLKLLAEGDMQAFAQAWQKQPVFASQHRLPPPVLARQNALRLEHDPRLLAAVLAATSLASMPDFWPSLASLAVPVTYMVGDEDMKFVDVLQRARQCTPGSRLLQLPECGHNPLMEAPDDLALALSREAL